MDVVRRGTRGVRDRAFCRRGLRLPSEDPFVGIDLDGCRDAGTGEVASWAKATIERFATYCELSPSGTGVHLILEGALPQGGRKRGQIECYDTGRYFTITGRSLNGDPVGEVEARWDEIEAWHAENFPAQNGKAKPPPPPPGASTDTDDAALLDRARRAKNGEKFRALFDQGDTKAYPSQSEADMALCMLLAFWTRRDASRMDRLFRRSALFRAKWDESAGQNKTYGQRTVDTAIEQLEPDRPVIRCGTDLHGNTCEAEAALAGLDEPRVYVRARGLVIVAREGARKIRGVKRDPGAPFVHELNPAALREHLSRAASWSRWNPKQQDWAPSLPSGPVVAALAARGSWPSLPPLAGVVEAPVFKPDGAVLDTPGYDEETALLFAPRGLNFPPVPSRPTAADVRTAAAALWEPLEQFEWEDPEWDRPVIVALALTFAARPAFEGPAPCFVFDSTTRGSGKGLACAAAVFGATGRRPPVSILSPAPEEQRKALFALALEGHRAILLDNVTRSLGGAVLSACLTAGEIRDRVLGASRSAAAPFDAVLLATGNNVRYVDDFDRRVLVARQVPTVERPEERQPPGGFRHPDLLGYVQAEHPRILSAALTLLRAYHVAGRPGHGLPPLGSFESWDALVRGTCLWAGVGDPLACRERVESVDEDRERLAALLQAWHGALGSTATTVAKAASQAATDESLRLALAAFDAKGDPAHPNVASIANRLKTVLGRIVEGRRLERVGKTSPATYRVGLVGLVGLDTADSHTRARAHARNGIGCEEPHETHETHGDPVEADERDAIRRRGPGGVHLAHLPDLRPGGPEGGGRRGVPGLPRVPRGDGGTLMAGAALQLPCAAQSPISRASGPVESS